MDWLYNFIKSVRLIVTDHGGLNVHTSKCKIVSHPRNQLTITVLLDYFHVKGYVKLSGRTLFSNLKKSGTVKLSI